MAVDTLSAMDLNLIQYRGIPPELIAEIGMMTIAAAGLDDDVYTLATELGHDPKKLRAGSSTAAASTVLKRLGADARLPPIASRELTLEAVTDWFEAAKECISHRHLVIHSRIVMQRQHGEDWSLVFFGQRVDAHIRPATVEEVRSLRKRIDGLCAQAIPLRIGLMVRHPSGGYVSHNWRYA